MKNNGVRSNDLVLDREIYYDNRKACLEQFRNNLKENNNEFAVMAVFRYILEQERFVVYITKTKHAIAKPKEESKYLESLVNEAKKVFGKDYETYYSKIKTN